MGVEMSLPCKTPKIDVENSPYLELYGNTNVAKFLTCINDETTESSNSEAPRLSRKMTRIWG